MVFGRTSQGVSFARELLKKTEATIVDENLRMGTVKALDDLLKQDELAELLPLSFSVEKSKYIIYSPRLHGSINVNDLMIHARAIAQNMGHGQHFINLVPLPRGRNLQLIEVIEASSGLKAGKDIGYHYFPPWSRRTDRASIWDGKREPWMAQAQDIERSEMEYIINILSILTERFRDVWLEHKQVFISEYVKGSAMLDFVDENFSRLQVYQGLSSLLVKSINEFIAAIIERVRAAIKAQGVRPAKGTVNLVWEVDDLDMLGEEEKARHALVRKLSDEFRRVEVVKQSEAENFLLNSQFQKGSALLLCTRNDFEALKGKGPDNVLVPAAPPS